MPENLTWEELKAAGESLISPDATGPITSADHRAYNLMMIAYQISFNDFSGFITTGGQLVSSKLKKRLVSKVVVSPDNTVISEAYIDKPFISDTLTFINGVELPPGTKITISFKQDPTAI